MASINETLTTYVCSGSPFGPYNENTGFLTICFVDTVILTVAILFLIAFGAYRLSQLRKFKAQLHPYSKIHVVELAAMVGLTVLAVVDCLGIYWVDHSVPRFKIVADILSGLSWMFALLIGVLEYNRGQKHSWIIITWWLAAFVIQSLQIQVILKESPESPFELVLSSMEFVLTTLLGLSALLCNELPPASYAKLQETGYEFAEGNGEESELSLLEPEETIAESSVDQQTDLDDDGLILHSSNQPKRAPHIKSPEEKSSLVSKLVFAWMDPLFRLGKKRSLNEKDMFPLSKQDKCHEVGDEAERDWFAQTAKENPSLLRAVAATYLKPFLVAGVLKLCQDLLIFVGPFLLQRVVVFVKDPTEPIWRGFVYALMMCLASIVQSLALHQYFFRVYRVGMHLRAGIVSLVYRKAFRMSFRARLNYTIGEIVNLQSIDSGRLESNIPYLHMIWSAPLQIIISLVLLYQVVGWTVFAGLGVMIVLVPINLKVGRILAAWQKVMMEIKDRRNKVTNEALQGIRVIKYFAWEESFIDKIRAVRTEEMANLRKSAYIRAATVFIWTGTPLLVSLATFSLFVLVGNTLSAEIAFTALALFNILRFPINMLPSVITGLIEGKVSVDRLQKYLLSDELDPNAVHRGNSAGDVAASIEGGEFSWKENEGERSTLQRIDLEIKRGQLVAIVGDVGCGKSSLLSALQGEMPKLNGNIELNGTVAYCPQQAWIQNATVKNNITFGLSFKEGLYEQSVAAAELKPDMTILPGGDETEIGEKGINLSGGQKQRVSIARAVYQDADIYLLDDPLSACDASTGKAIFDNCIQGILKNKTRVLVTHQLQYLKHSDLVVYMKEGQIMEMGPFTKLMADKGAFATMMTEYGGSGALTGALTAASNAAGEPANASTETPIIATTPELEKKEEKVEKKAEKKLIAAEEKEEGSVKASVYKSYIVAIGGLLVAGLILGTFVLEYADRMTSDWWLSYWSTKSAEGDTRTGFYLGLYGFFGLTYCLLVLARSFTIVHAGLKAAISLHDKMLRSVFRAPTSFFDTTPIGRILNRFSKDTYAVDESLPRTMTQAISTLFQVFSVILVIFGVTPWFLVLALPLAFFYRHIQQLYLHSSRELQRLNSMSRSPIFAGFSETISGISTIRAYGKQEYFTSDNERRVDKNQEAYFLSTTANRWLGLRLEVVGTFVVFGATFFSVMNRGTIAPGLAGLSITYALQLTSTLNWMVRMSTDVENELVSVERVEQYTRIESEAPPIVEPRPPKDWPAEGDILFENLSLRYRPDLPLVLKNISCHIHAHEKVGIVGRTGSGKSSAMVALFRHVEPEEGRIVIDGLDIHQMGLDDLRSRLAIIPQDPTLFTGTIRSNLDPFNQYDDRSLWHALEVTGLKPQMDDKPEGLDAKVSEFGENLSVGTRQLMCLARAVLRKPRILVLDEATANISYAEDAVIQATLREQFKDATVLTIAHRINTILDSNRVLVLDQGEIKEFDAPSILLANPESLFAKLVHKSQAAHQETFVE